MKILLDEQIPQPVLAPLSQMLNKWHQIDHIHTINWKSKKDEQLLSDLVKRGYQVLVTADLNQLYRPKECQLIQRGGFHHVRFEQHGSGVAATASAIATIVAGLPAILPILERADGQRLVLLKPVRCGEAGHEICDPKEDPPTYWPGRQEGSVAPRQRKAAKSEETTTQG